MFVFKTKIDSSKIVKFSKFEIYNIIPKIAIISVFLLLIAIIHFFQKNKLVTKYVQHYVADCSIDITY